MYYLIGLGNPGDQYALTPHNIGRDIVQSLHGQYSCRSWYHEGGKKVTTARCSSVMLVLPETYMNNSGDAVAALAQEYAGLEPFASKVIVFHDDVDLPIGSFKISQAKGAGGHHGVESIEQSLGTNEFIRIRVGVSPVDENGILRKPQGRDAVTKYILSPMSPAQQRRIQELLPNIKEALESIFTDGVAKAMSLYNS